MLLPKDEQVKDLGSDLFPVVYSDHALLSREAVVVETYAGADDNRGLLAGVYYIM
jgi:hypothetical protein